MSKFKIGDRVIGNDFHEIMSRRGRKGVVKGLAEMGVWVVYDGETDVHVCAYPELDLLLEEGVKEVWSPVVVTGNAFKYGYKVGDVVEWKNKHYTVAGNGWAYSKGYAASIAFLDNKEDYSLVKSVGDEVTTPKYLTTITTTTHLEQGQVESLLIKALGIKNGADVQWNQDGSVDVVCISKGV